MYYLFLQNIQFCLGLPSIRLAGYDKANCSSLIDYEDMEDVRDCTKFAREADLTFGGGVFFSSVPKGCYWKKWYKRGKSSRFGGSSGSWNVEINFNYHLTGDSDEDRSPICIKKKGRLIYP